MRFKGYTPIITPFRQDFSIDWDAYAEVGGYKQSGFGGRDNALAANDQCTETKTIWIDLSDDHIDDTITGSTAQS